MFKRAIIMAGLIVVLTVSTACALSVTKHGLHFAGGNATAFDKDGNKAAEGGEASLGLLAATAKIVDAAASAIPFGSGPAPVTNVILPGAEVPEGVGAGLAPEDDE